MAIAAFGLLTVTLATPDSSEAQGPPAPAPHARWQDIPLDAGGRVQLTVAGQLRVRAEQVSHYLLGAEDDRTDRFGAARAFLSADLRVVASPGTRLRLVAEGRHARSLDRDLPGGAQPSDEDRADVQRLFGEVAFGREPSLVARVGRQELTLGNQRLVGVSDWSNVRRTFDGASLGVRSHVASVDAFWTRPVVVRQRQPNRADPLTQFWGLTASGPSEGDGHVWQLYALGLTEGQGDGGPIAHRRLTTGGRLAGPVASSAGWRVTYDLESAWQSGRLAGRAIGAGFVASEVTGALPGRPLAPSLTLGLDVGSGDRVPADRHAGTFDPLFPSGQKQGGYVDIVGPQNLTEWSAALTATPVARLQTRLAAYQFARTSLHDGAYGRSGALLRAAGDASADGASARGIGAALITTANYTVSRGLRLLGGYGHFVPRAFLRAAPETSHPIDWGFLGTTVTF